MDSIYTLTSVQITAVLVVLMAIAAELGYERGRLRALRNNSGITTSRAIIKTAMLAMVGLLLAFSYSMAASRYDLRYTVVMREANSVGTVWLRAGFLPEPSRTQAKGLLRKLVEVRLDHWEAMTTPAEYERTANELDRIQNDLWGVVERAYNGSAEAVRLVPLVQALNDMIDISAERKGAAWNHVPGAVIVVLLICITISAFLVGHSSGEAEWRDWLMWTLFLALIAMVFYIMLDLDRGATGFIRVNPAPFLDLQKGIHATPA